MTAMPWISTPGRAKFVTAARVVTVGELLLADLDEAVAEPRLFDEDGHRDEVRKRSTDSLERLVHQREHAVGLRLEVSSPLAHVGISHSAPSPGPAP
jgi:hypothetical protein